MPDRPMPKDYRLPSENTAVNKKMAALKENENENEGNSGLNNLVFQLYYKGFIETDKIYYHAIRKIEDGGFPIKVLPGIEIVEYE
jgi:hypothetical protein